MLLTSSDTAWDFIIIFDVASVLLYKYCTRCAFYKGLRTSFIRLTLLLLLKFSLYYLCLLRYLIALLLLRVRVQFCYLIHLYVLLSLFHLLFLLVLGDYLAEGAIQILMLSTLAIRTRFHVGHACRTWLATLLIDRCVPRRVRSRFSSPVDLAVQGYLRVLGLANAVWVPMLIIGVLGSFLAFTIVRRLHYVLLNSIYNLFNSSTQNHWSKNMSANSPH